MKILFGLSVDLKFHHRRIPIPNYKPKITTCFDNFYNAETFEFILNEVETEDIGGTESSSGGKLTKFDDIFDNIKIENIFIPESFYTRFKYNQKTIGLSDEKYFPKDSTMLFFVYATHLNSYKVPCQVCVGMATLSLHKAYLMWKSKGENKVSIKLQVTNREAKAGYITVKIQDFEMIQGKDHWVDCAFGYNESSKVSHKEAIEQHDKKVSEVSKKHAEDEYKWISGFYSMWEGTKNMMDLWAFMMKGYGIPIEFFLQRDRSDIRENGFKVLAYFAMKRYALEHNLEPASIPGTFKKLQLIEKCSILGTMITILSTSHFYNTDYYITGNSSKVMFETFQSPSKSDSGDCEVELF